MKKIFISFSLLILITFLFYQYGRSVWHPIVLKVIGKNTVSDVIAKYGDETKKKLAPQFRQVGLSYPPQKLALIAFKDTKTLELWAKNEEDSYKLVSTYPIKATSGALGPKLKEGDRQVPEGMYKIIGFNPNSSYHLSMKLNYPNKFDLKNAKEEGRSQPGTNIFIHGQAVSIGCLAMGDPAIEELFSLVYATGKENTTIIISPTDPSKRELVVPEGAPSWTAELYQNISSQYKLIKPSD